MVFRIEDYLKVCSKPRYRHVEGLVDLHNTLSDTPCQYLVPISGVEEDSAYDDMDTWAKTNVHNVIRVSRIVWLFVDHQDAMLFALTWNQFYKAP